MKPLFTLLCLVLFFSCKTETEASTELVTEKPSLDIKKELVAIETLRQRFQQAIKEKRYQDLGAFVTPDVISYVPASEEWKAYRRLREKPLGKFRYDSLIMYPKETVIMNDSMAYDFGTSKVYFANENGENVELENSFLVILKKVDGDWKLFREIASGTVK